MPTQSQSEPVLDPQRSEAFADRLVEMMNHGAACLMISIGHRTGLFDALRELSSATSEEIADTAGLDERYVREWLGAMVLARIVEYEPDTRLHRLPPEHAAWLTRASAADNVAVFAQYIPILGAVEDKILRCFREGGGLAYEDYPRFHQVMAEDSGQSVVSSLLESILPLAPGLPERLEEGIEVLDVGCGSGRALNLLARTYPRSRFLGYDLCEDAVAAGRAQAREEGLDNVRFEPRDAETLDERSRFDLVTAFDAIHDQARPDKVLAGIRQALRPDGVFLMQDIAGSSHVEKNLDHPLGTLLYTVSCLHCMSVSLGQGGMGLGAMWGEEKAREMLAEAGFGSVEKHSLPHDIQNDYYIVRKSA